MAYSYLFKYITIGDSGVGKSSLLLQFTDRRFSHEHDITIGVEFGSKFITIDNLPIKLQIWDTSGQEAFRSIVKSYYRGSAVALLVYDITRRKTFDSLLYWVNELKSCINFDMIIMLIGNKNDLPHRREVTYEEGEKFAKDNGMIFMETSARTKYKVDDIFSISATKVYNNVIDKGENIDFDALGVKLGAENNKYSEQNIKKKKSRGCCW